MQNVAEILKSEATMISNPESPHTDLITLIKNRLDGYVTATKYVLMIYNIHNDQLTAAMKVTPGKRSPTITALDDGECKSVSALVPKKDQSSIMDQLHKVGATDILVLDVSNSRM